MAKKKKPYPHATLLARGACPKCGATNRSGAIIELRVEMRPILTPTVPHFPEALAEALVLKCFGCGYRICLDYSIALDDNPELDLNYKSVHEPA